jgi:hypothetical protein
MTNKTEFPQLTEVLNQETPTIKKLPIFYSLFTIKRFREENEFLDIKATAFDATPRENFVYCIPFYKRISKCF